MKVNRRMYSVYVCVIHVHILGRRMLLLCFRVSTCVYETICIYSICIPSRGRRECMIYYAFVQAHVTLNLDRVRHYFDYLAMYVLRQHLHIHLEHHKRCHADTCTHIHAHKYVGETHVYWNACIYPHIQTTRRTAMQVNHTRIHVCTHTWTCIRSYHRYLLWPRTF